MNTNTGHSRLGDRFHTCATLKYCPLLSILCVLSHVANGTTFADKDLAATAPSSKSGGSDVLDEVTVTARKRRERLIDVPVAATALTTQDIARYEISTFAAIAQQTPQLLIGPVPSDVGGVINIRGIGASEVGVANDQPVSINVDGFALSQATVLSLGQYDLDNVEVLKGPQTVFFGKNSPAGVVSLRSKDPGKDFEGQIRAGYEFYNQQRYLEGIVSGPIGAGFSARFVGYVSGENGWFRNNAVPNGAGVTSTDPAQGPNGNEKFGRLTVKYESPESRFDAKLKLSYGEINLNNDYGFDVQNFSCTGPMPTFNVSVKECQLNRFYQESNIPASIVASSPEGAFKDGRPYSDTNQILGILELNYTFTDTLKLTSVTGLYKLHEDVLDSSATNSELALLGFRGDIGNRQYTEELRLASSFNGPVNFQTGLYAQDRSTTEWGPVAFAPGFLAAEAVEIPVVYTVDTTHAYSGFGEITYKFLPQFELAAGERYSREIKGLGGTQGGGTFDAPVVDIARGLANSKRTFTNLSPEVTISYKPATDFTVYGSFREGFVSGGFNNPNSAGSVNAKYNASYDQTTARGGEIGFKGYAFDRQLRFDVTSYFYKYFGLQVNSIDPITIASVTSNAATATIKGAETNAFLSPDSVRGLSVRVGLAYNDAVYGTFDSAGCYGGQTIVQGCSGNLQGQAFTTQSLSGQPLQRAPRWTANPGFTYDHGIAEEVSGTFSFDAAFMSSYFSQLEENPSSRVPGFWTLNTAFAVRGKHGAWEVAVIGRNIANKLAVISSFDNLLTGSGKGTAAGVRSDLVGALNAPRTIALQFTVRSSWWTVH
jgi:iron complex outermembrane receptor protein